MALSKDERMARARAKMGKLKDATKSNRRADRIDWRPRAKIVIHPDSDIIERLRVWVPALVEIKEGKNKGKEKLSSRPFNVSKDPEKDPFARLRKALRLNKEIDDDEVILSIGKGRNKSEMVKGEILGLEGYDYRKSLRPREDVVMAAVLIEDAKKKAPEKYACEILAGAKTLGKEIRKEIESEVDESGEEEGNPFFTPYPFVIEFDEEEQGSDMYTARARPTDKVPEEVLELLEEDAPDLESEVKLSDVDEMCSWISDALVCEDIAAEDYEVADAVFNKGKGSGKGKKDEEESDADDGDAEPEKPRVRRTRRTRDEDEEDGDADDGDGEDEPEPEKPRTRRTRRIRDEDDDDQPPPRRRRRARDEEEDEGDEEESDAGEDEEEETPPPRSSRRRSRREEEESEPEEEEPDPEPEEEPEKPPTSRRRRAKPEPEEEEEPDPEPEEEPEKGKGKGKGSGKGKTGKGKKAGDGKGPDLGWEPKDGEQYDICPQCRNPVPQDAKECPHPGCDAVFADGDEEF